MAERDGGRQQAKYPQMAAKVVDKCSTETDASVSETVHIRQFCGAWSRPNGPSQAARNRRSVRLSAPGHSSHVSRSAIARRPAPCVSAPRVGKRRSIADRGLTRPSPGGIKRERLLCRSLREGMTCPFGGNTKPTQLGGSGKDQHGNNTDKTALPGTGRHAC